MRTDVYRKPARRSSDADRPTNACAVTPAERGHVEDLVAPLLFVAVGILMLFTGISGGTTHAPEAGLGVIALLFGLWSLGTTIAETRS